MLPYGQIIPPGALSATYNISLHSLSMEQLHFISSDVIFVCYHSSFRIWERDIHVYLSFWTDHGNNMYELSKIGVVPL